MNKRSVKKITFVRHGLSTANHEGIVQGQKDYPLHSKGVKQAELLAHHWADLGRTFDQIITSPLRRAKDTAAVIASTLSTPFVEDPIWLERSFGAAEGKAYTQIGDYLSIKAKGWTRNDPIFMHSETESDLLKRATIGVNSILLENHRDILVVSHGGILGAAMRSILGIPLPQVDIRPPGFHFDNTGYSELSFDPDASRWQILAHNLKPHLERKQ